MCACMSVGGRDGRRCGLAVIERRSRATPRFLNIRRMVLGIVAPHVQGDSALYQTSFARNVMSHFYFGTRFGLLHVTVAGNLELYQL